MAIGPREVSFTINVDTGKVTVEKGSDVSQTGPDPAVDKKPGELQPEEQAIGREIDDIKRGKRHLPVGEIIQINESPGCVYWNGKRWVKYC